MCRWWLAAGLVCPLFTPSAGAAGPLTPFQAQQLRRVQLPAGCRIRNVADGLLGPDGLAIDEQGRLYACIELEARVIRIRPDGRIETVLTNVRYPEAICYVPGGHLYVGEDTSPARIHHLDVNTLRAEVISDGRFGHLEGIYVNHERAICWVGCYKWEIGSNVVRAAFDCIVSRAGQAVALTAGQPVPDEALIYRGLILPRPAGAEHGVTEIVFDAAGRQYFGTEGSSVCRVGDDAKVEVVAEGLATPEGLCFDARGNLWVAEESAGRICRIDAEYLANRRPTDAPARPSPDGDVAVFASGLGALEDVLVTSDGRVFASCDGLFSILLIEPEPEAK